MNTDEIFEKAEMFCVLAAQEPDVYTEVYTHWNTLAQQHEHTGWKVMRGKTQHDKIMNHLQKAGSITVREALVEYSIQSLTKRIQELRGMGHNIVSKVKQHPITGQRYTRYTLQS